MGKYKERTGKTRIGNFLKNTAPHLLDVVGEVLPEKGALGIVKNLIQKDTKMSPEEKASALELLQLDLENTKDARDMQKVALQQTDLFSKRFVYYLASFWSLIGGVFIFMVLFKPIPTENVRLIDTILGFLLGTIVATIINFFFGSSKGSSDKMKQLSGLIKRNKD